MIRVSQKEFPTRVARNTSKHSTHQVAKKSPRHAAAETLVVLNDGVQPSDDVDDAAKEFLMMTNLLGVLLLKHWWF